MKKIDGLKVVLPTGQIFRMKNILDLWNIIKKKLSLTQDDHSISSFVGDAGYPHSVIEKQRPKLQVNNKLTILYLIRYYANILYN